MVEQTVRIGSMEVAVKRNTSGHNILAALSFNLDFYPGLGNVFFYLPSVPSSSQTVRPYILREF